MALFLNGLIYTAMVVAIYTAGDWVYGHPFLHWAGNRLKMVGGAITAIGYTLVVYNFFPSMLYPV